MSERAESGGSGSGRAATQRGGERAAPTRWFERVVEASGDKRLFTQSRVKADGLIWGAHLDTALRDGLSWSMPFAAGSKRCGAARFLEEGRGASDIGSPSGGGA